jgi:hypothetical protein
VRATSLALNWLGLASPNELSVLEAASIGREHLPAHRRPDDVRPLPLKYERLVRAIGTKNPTRLRITKHYMLEMADALREMSRVLAQDGHMILIVGNNQVCGESVRNDEYVCHVLQGLGLTLDIALIDDIKSRGLMTKRNKTASVISRESVLVFSKH